MIRNRVWLKVRKQSRTYSKTKGMAFDDKYNCALADKEQAYKAIFWQQRAQGWLVIGDEYRSARIRSSKRNGWFISVRTTGGSWHAGHIIKTRKEAKLKAISWVYGASSYCM